MQTAQSAPVSATEILLSDGVILLGAAVLFVILFRRFGLGAVLGIMRAHGGIVDVQSTPGTGTRFLMAFPVAEDLAGLPEEESDPEPAQFPQTGSTAGFGTILVVDDEEGPRLICERMLTRQGFEVILAENGERALKAFQKAPALFRMVILDYTMPGMNGEELLREMRRLRPDLPALFFSGYSDRFLAGLPEFDPPALFLQKPFRAAQLVDKVYECLKAVESSGAGAGRNPKHEK